MKAYDILRQLYRTVPDLTPDFSFSVNIQSISVAGTTVTVITDSAHALLTDDECYISGIGVRNTIVSARIFNGTLSATTENNHDFTDGYQENFEIIGATEPEFNDTFDLIGVPNRTNMVGAADGKPNVDSISGAPYTLETTGYSYNQINGIHKVTVVSETELTYEIENPVNAVLEILDTAQLASGYRITGAVSFEACRQKYTEQTENDYWMFVVLGTTTSSKDRKNNSDAIYPINANSGYKQQLVQNFTVYVFADCSETISARPVRDKMEDIFEVLVKSLCGYKLPNLFGENYYSIVFDSHFTQYYDKAVYAHVYNFQTVAQINECQIFEESKDVAFRDAFLEITYETENVS